MKRREFMKSLGAVGSLSAMDTLFNALISGTQHKAYAQAVGNEPRKYIMAFINGAPSRCMFDLFLNPDNNANFVRNPGIGTHFNGNAQNLQYQQVNIGGKFVPFMWQHNVAAPNAGETALAGLLNNMINVRGIVLPTDGHPENVNRHFRPEVGLPSIHGLIADATKAPIPALTNRYATDSFRSAKGISMTSVNTTVGFNSIAELLAPFEYTLADNFKTKKDVMEDVMERAVAAIQVANSASGLPVSNMFADRNNAIALVKRTFNNLDQTWNILVAKYKDLFLRSQLPNAGGIYPNGIPGISDQAIPVPQANRANRFRSDGGVPGVFNQDLRTLVTDNTYWNRAVEGFAMAEFVITQKLVGSVTIGSREVRNANIQVASGGAFQATSVTMDHHGTDAAVAQFLNTMMFRGYGACLIELINVLKANNLFNETIVEFTSEFNRSPRTNMSGSDHAFLGASTSMWSGLFPQGLQVVGNIRRDSGDADYTGTWGIAAPTFADGQPIRVADVCHTKAALLKAPGLVTNNGRLIINAQGQVAPGLTADQIDV